jgi:methylamine dehydrogenase heavy chain
MDVRTLGDSMKIYIGVAAAVLLSSTASQAAKPAGSVPPPLQAEQLSIAKLPERNPHWVYVVDVSFGSMIDARVRLFDGATNRRLGQIDAGFSPGVAISPDGHTTAVATSYFARGSRGTRTDVVELNDNRTLDHVAEIIIPSKHAQNVPTAFNASYSDDSRFLFVANITPATSISVVDVANRKFVTEIDTAGCVLAYGGGNRRVSALCESGKALTITVDDDGKEVSRALSEPFFDVDKDPIFVSGAKSAAGMAFVSFLGNVLEVDMQGEKVNARPAWSFVSDAERKQGWRPGGLQPVAIHRPLNRLYVVMHQGGAATHKDPGSEVWVLDLKSQKRLARWKLGAQKIAPVLAVQVSQDGQPQVSMLTATSDLILLDGLSGKLRHTEKQMGTTSSLLLHP